MDDFISRRKSNATGGSIGIFILPSGRCGHGTTSACGATSNGRNTGLHRKLRTFAASYEHSLAGYYQLRRDDGGGVEIAYFGLLPEFIGRGLGGPLLTSAIEQA